MTLTAALLLLASTWLHAGWNLLSKQRSPTAAFFLVANTIGCLGLLPALLLAPQLPGAFPPTVWALLGLTGVFQALYYTALAGAYRSGDLSVAYPLARSFAVVLVPVITTLLGQGKALSGRLLLGMALVAVGCVLVPLRDWRAWRWADHGRVTGLFALVAGCATAGYSIVDDLALRHLRDTFSNVRPAALAGVGIFLAYTLVLVAMGYVRNISYVVAFRQLGIVWGTFLGVLVLRETRTGMKFVGVAVLVVGLVLVGTG
jgi:drug/metabolite transporter (DMT)-like permease